ncbi:hypothetical protein XELAEV_18006366mg [Xenopus laevis]|uniref:Uncharacterized protein n=1 Tax=Xenopus laevis TaxID=8355 RepID=A0A974E111_XENLA|nr:hypothetical protein XELAEV_18006366mg [Xenopus laevis]
MRGSSPTMGPPHQECPGSAITLTSDSSSLTMREQLCQEFTCGWPRPASPSHIICIKSCCLTSSFTLGNLSHLTQDLLQTGHHCTRFSTGILPSSTALLRWPYMQRCDCLARSPNERISSQQSDHNKENTGSLTRTALVR